MSHRSRLLVGLPLAAGLASTPLFVAACSSSSSAPGETGGKDDAGNAATSSDGGSAPVSPSDAGSPSSDSDATTPSGNSGDASSAFIPGQPLPEDGGAPPGFWDSSNIPAAKNVMMFKFLNRTNGQYQDGEVYWSFKNGNVNETHSIADQPTYDMPANASGRMYFYLCATGDTTCASDPTKSKYYDFIEHTIGATQYNGNTTRVDAFGIKIAMRLHCSDGYDVAVGENYATFAEDRAATFQAFINEVPPAFQALAQAPYAPYRIVEPGADSFKTGGANADYYDSFVDSLWAANGITVAKPGPNGSGLGSYPDLSAAIYRHVGNVAGTFSAAGKLQDKTLWSDASTFYTAAPMDYYARFWHERALNGKAYGFPYDDVGGYSSYISHSNPQYMLVAIGW
jgi:hypothetical protein